jgi:hypothetical protein
MRCSVCRDVEPKDQISVVKWTLSPLSICAIPFRLQPTLDELFKLCFRQIMSQSGRVCKIFVDIYN